MAKDKRFKDDERDAIEKGLAEMQEDQDILNAEYPKEIEECDPGDIMEEKALAQADRDAQEEADENPPDELLAGTSPSEEEIRKKVGADADDKYDTLLENLDQDRRDGLGPW